MRSSVVATWALAVLVMLAGAAPPAAGAPGLNFTWSPDGRCMRPLVTNQNFTCNANDATFIAVGSVEPSFSMTGFSGLEATINCQSEGPLPDWWQSFNPGSCRQTSASVRSTFVSGGGCYNLWSANTQGGIGAWQTALYPPPMPPLAPAANHLVIKLVFIMATARSSLNASRVYEAFQLVVDTRRTVADPDSGVAACAGCGTGLTLTLDRVDLFGDDNIYDTVSEEQISRCLTWQSSTAECWNAVPVRNTSWGAIKSFYR